MTSKSWRTVTILECLAPINLSSKSTIQAKDYNADGKYPIIDQGQKYISGWTNNSDALITENLPLIIFGDHTRALKYVETPFVRGADGTQVLKPKQEIDPLFFYYACKWLDIPSRGYNRHFGLLKESEINISESFQEQKNIGLALKTLDQLSTEQLTLIDQFQQLKVSAMQTLFSRGLRGESQRDTEIGPVPESWEVKRLDTLADVISTRMSYGDLLKAENLDTGVRVQGIKVSDMNLIGNETQINRTNLEIFLPLNVLKQRCAPPMSIVLPKRGAAIATNKKRMTKEWSVFDPNVIGVYTQNFSLSKYIFQWFQSFDLRKITEPGPTPQINKKHLEPLLLPFPGDDEQAEIVAILDAIDQKIDLHKRKRAVLEELFESLLHKLMTGELRVTDLNLAALGIGADTTPEGAQ